MEKSIQDILCYRLSSQGLPQPTVHLILNTISKWVKCSGKQWTVDRLKALHHYYCEFIANQTDIDEFLKVKGIPYFGLRRDGLPKGAFKCIFKCKNTKKVLNVLSCHADFINKSLTNEQYKKFIKGVTSNTDINQDIVIDYINKNPCVFGINSEVFKPSEGYFTSLKKISLSYVGSNKCPRHKIRVFPFSSIYDKGRNTFNSFTKRKRLNELGLRHIGLSSRLHVKHEVPGFEIITTKTIPINIDGMLNYKVKDRSDVAVAYAYSWYTVPKVTMDYIVDQYSFYHLPDGLVGNEIHSLEGWDGLSLTKEQRDNIVGTIGLIQEKSLKLRAVANPNKITQHYLKPFGNKLYYMLSQLTSDCTYDQNSGAIWCQNMLIEGRTLAAVDLSAATDTLDVKSCINIIEKMFFNSNFNTDDNLDPSWVMARNHFIKICKEGKWSIKTPQGSIEYIKYAQGQPMGTYPSFAILGLTNNLIGYIAALDAGLDPNNSFRVVGDDICMLAEMQETYIKLIESIGGSVNNEKTLVSSKVTEFTGGIILRDGIFRKTTKSAIVDDNNFMSKIKSFGTKIIRSFKPKQSRTALTKGIFIPGVAIDGPWTTDSFGVPLSLRIDYAFRLSSLMSERIKPDSDFYDKQQFVTFLYWSLKAKDKTELFEFSCPSFLSSDFRSEILLENASIHFDQIEYKTTLLDSLSRRDLPTFSKHCIKEVNSTLIDIIHESLPPNIMAYIDNFCKYVIPSDDSLVSINEINQKLEYISELAVKQWNNSKAIKQIIPKDFGSNSVISKKIIETVSKCDDPYIKYMSQNMGKELIDTLDKTYFSFVWSKVLSSLTPDQMVDVVINAFRKSEMISSNNYKVVDRSWKESLLSLSLGINILKYHTDSLLPFFHNTGTIIDNQPLCKVLANCANSLLLCQYELIDRNKWLRNFNWSRPLCLDQKITGKKFEELNNLIKDGLIKGSHTVNTDISHRDHISKHVYDENQLQSGQKRLDQDRVAKTRAGSSNELTR